LNDREEIIDKTCKRIQHFLQGTDMTLNLSRLGLGLDSSLTGNGSDILNSVFSSEVAAQIAGHGIRALNLSKNGLKSLPETIGNLAGLETLDLSKNVLDTLPDSIGNLQALKRLDITENHFKKKVKQREGGTEVEKEVPIPLPESIGNLKSLEILYMSYDAVGSVPLNVSNLNSHNFPFWNTVVKMRESAKQNKEKCDE
jgi:Leucine-rich repeat (LRR) protein